MRIEHPETIHRTVITGRLGRYGHWTGATAVWTLTGVALLAACAHDDLKPFAESGGGGEGTAAAGGASNAIGVMLIAGLVVVAGDDDDDEGSPVVSTPTVSAAPDGSLTAMDSLAFADPGPPETPNGQLTFRFLHDTSTDRPTTVPDVAQLAAAVAVGGAGSPTTIPAGSGTFGTFMVTWNAGTGRLNWEYESTETSLRPLGGEDERYDWLAVAVSDGTTDGDPVQVVVRVEGVNDAPAGAGNTANLPSPTTPLTFTVDHFNRRYTDPDMGDAALHSVVIASLPTAGTLTLDGADVREGQTVPASAIPTLVYRPDAGFTTDSFTFHVSDGTAISDSDPGMDGDQPYTMMLASSFPVVQYATGQADGALEVGEDDDQMGEALVGGILAYSDRSPDGSMETPPASLLFKTGHVETMAAVARGSAPPDAPAATTAGTAGMLPSVSIDGGGTGRYGTFSFAWVDAQGAVSNTPTGRLRWSYDLDQTHTAVQGLNAGQVLYERVSLLANDRDTDPMTGGDSAPVTLLVTVVGAEDPTTLAVAGTSSDGTAGTVTAGNLAVNVDESATTAPSVISGTYAIADADDDPVIGGVAGTGASGAFTPGSAAVATTNNPNMTAGARIAGTFGTFYLRLDGTWTYELDNTNQMVDDLGPGDMLTETFALRAAAGAKQSPVRVITITIDGRDETNGMATITEAVDDNMPQDFETLTVTVTDPDMLVPGMVDFQFFFADDTGGTNRVEFDNDVTTPTPTAPATEAEATVVLDSSQIGKYIGVDYSYTDSDGTMESGTVYSAATVVARPVTGAAPMLTLANGTAYMLADTANSPSNSPSAETLVTVTDATPGETLSTDDMEFQVAGSGSDWAALVSGTPVPFFVDGVQWGTLLYISASGVTGVRFETSPEAVNGLGDMVEFEINLVLRVTDNDMNRAIVPVTLTVTGADDRPTLTVVSTDTEVTEEGTGVAGDDDASGTINIMDPDTLPTPQTGHVLQARAGTAAYADATQAGLVLTGTYGDLTIDDEGNWTYELIDERLATEILTAASMDIVDGFDIRVDGDDMTKVDLDISVTGSNDGPEFAANGRPAGVDVYEGEPGVAASGTLMYASPTEEARVTGYSAATGTYGTYDIDDATNEWSYTLTANTQASALNHDGHLTETIVLTVNYDSGESTRVLVTFDINGRTALQDATPANANPSITGTAANEIIQGGDNGDTIFNNTVNGGFDVIAPGHGEDTVRLGAGTETVVYRYSSSGTGSTGWQAVDGNVTVRGFRIGVDKLVFVDVDSTEVTSWTSFLADSAAQTNLEFRIIGTAFVGGSATKVGAMLFTFPRAGTVDGQAGSAASGASLQVHFDDTDLTELHDVSSLLGQLTNVNRLTDYTVLADIFGGANTLDAIGESQLAFDIV